jgi:hypothetical protein
MTAGDEIQPQSDATRGGVYASHGWRTSILGKDRKSIIEIGDQFPMKSDLMWNPRARHPVRFSMNGTGVSVWRERQDKTGS